MSDIDNVIDTLDLRGHGNIVGGMILRARAELAQLRADLHAARNQAAMLDDYAETIRQHEITIAAQETQIDALHDALTKIREAQARQLEHATNLIRRIFEMADSETSTVEIESDSLMWQIEADTRAWLAVNAPQAQPEEQSA